MTAPLSALDALLVMVLAGLKDGKMNLKSVGNTNTSESGPWRGLHNVVIRYDCVTFWLDEKRYTEARCSMVPSATADRVRAIWSLLGVNFEHAVDAYSIASQHRI